MSWQFGDRHVSAVAVIDDLSESREAFELMLVDAELEPLSRAGPLGDLEHAVGLLTSEADAAICDHDLSARNYASFTGARLVAESVSRGLPAILCTRWIGSGIDDIRPHLPGIPVILRPDELNEPDELRVALEACLAEMSGDIGPARKPWRTQVVVERIDGDDNDVVYVSLPAWPLEEMIRLRKRYLPEDVGTSLIEGYRCHAMVNLGSESADFLFFNSWKLPD